MIGPITDFPYLLQQVSDHMSCDKTLPALNGVYFEARGAYLYAVATDRHTMAVTRRRLETRTARPWAVLVGEQELKSLRAFARLNRRTPLTLEFRPATVDLFKPNALAVRAGGQSLEVPGYDGELPALWARDQWRETLTSHLHSAPNLRQELTLNPTLLARWGRSGGVARNAPLTVWTGGPGKPLVITCGEDFVGLQMPIRVSSDAAQPADIVSRWGDLASHAGQSEGQAA
ncbi:hypothetical protein AB0I77_45155 [Streptomyces sp. NPDC050619]|uniref:DNA polymerase III subunit beta family protein n=1 Tax=Streptomyces sp. NPDC050619 TaxID=3157214 RepID=UPI0034238469